MVFPAAQATCTHPCQSPYELDKDLLGKYMSQAYSPQHMHPLPRGVRAPDQVMRSCPVLLIFCEAFPPKVVLTSTTELSQMKININVTVYVKLPFSATQ